MLNSQYRQRKNGGFKTIKETKIVDNQIQVILAGSIYVEDARDIKETLTSFIDEGKTSFLIDLSQVDYIDSTGLGMLVSIHKRAVQKGGSFKLKGLHGLVKEVFELTRLNKVIEIQK